MPKARHPVQVRRRLSSLGLNSKLSPKKKKRGGSRLGPQPLVFQRLAQPLISQSFFIFGARGTGKSTLLRGLLGTGPDGEEARVQGSSDHTGTPALLLWVDLLRAEDEERFGRDPSLLGREVRARLSGGNAARAAAREVWVVIDEVQKMPKLLDEVHSLIESPDTRSVRFALTGSSARKLKLAGANLLAGRAYVNELYPLSFLEMGAAFDLGSALNWGTLPHVVGLAAELERQEYLRTYARAYLKQEVWEERLVQNLDPFRRFLEVAAQANGMILNFSKISQQTGVDDKTVKKYFEILVDTFLGFYLEPYSRSVRAQQRMTPKFYWFDPGVKRAMEGLITVPVVPQTYGYGRAFEHFILCECIRLNAYFRKDFRFSYLRSKDGAEVDLVIERPGLGPFLIEIKSGDRVGRDESRGLRRFIADFPDGEFRIWSNDQRPQKWDRVLAKPWREGMSEVFDFPLSPPRRARN